MKVLSGLILVLVGLSCVYASADVLVVNQCYNGDVDPFCIYKFSFMNCNSYSVTVNYNVSAADGKAVTYQSNMIIPAGWNNGNSYICAEVFTSIDPPYPTPWTAHAYGPNGVLSSSIWDGCTNTSTKCSPAGYNCFTQGTYTAAPKCPSKRR